MSLSFNSLKRLIDGRVVAVVRLDSAEQLVVQPAAA
jgi:hypothetical protein